jgi:hypothetical protein
MFTLLQKLLYTGWCSGNSDSVAWMSCIIIYFDTLVILCFTYSHVPTNCFTPVGTPKSMRDSSGCLASSCVLLLCLQHSLYVHTSRWTALHRMVQWNWDSSVWMSCISIYFRWSCSAVLCMFACLEELLHTSWHSETACLRCLVFSFTLLVSLFSPILYIFTE